MTGNLYRPKGTQTGKLPAVLCPHGHWPDGRFYDAGAKEIRKQIVEGAERFEVGGRYPLQARCVQLARMGCVVFHYDMVGYADSLQLDHRAGHSPGDERSASTGASSARRPRPGCKPSSACKPTIRFGRWISSAGCRTSIRPASA